jgi:23S rRNA pseudouridine955/2504/2580 synthase
MEQVTYQIIDKEQDIGQRLDNFLLKTLKGVPKSRIYRIIRAGEVRINKKRAKPDTRLQAQDVVRIPPVRVSEEVPKGTLPPAFAKQLTEAILFEDDGLMVINKPTGLAVHGGSGIKWGVIEAYRALKTDFKYLELVHRLDRETSGLLLLAKKSSVLKQLQQQWQANQVQKIYWAICNKPWHGKPQTTVQVPLLKNTLKSGERMVVVSRDGKPAISHIHLVKNHEDCCWVKVSIETGRTHQIRVHCAHIGHPILGDEKYGHYKMPRLYLHAQKIKFQYRDEMRTFTADVDGVFQEKLHCFEG